MDDLDLAILVCLEDEESSEEETRAQECDIYKKRETEGAYEILIVRHHDIVRVRVCTCTRLLLQ
jgi:hypothetical protein